jgi:hypothetical protein
MNLEATLQTLSGKQVSAKTIPGNTVEVWLDVPPKAANAIVFGVDAPWRLVRSGKIIATSAEIPWDIEVGESEADYRARNDLARGVSDFLIGQVLETASCDSKTGDLTLTFEGEVVLQCFTVWRDEPQWTLRLYADSRRLGFECDEAI